MGDIADLVRAMERSPLNVRFSDLQKVCRHFFGSARRAGGPHEVYRTPWAGDPRVNIQASGGQAQAYQVRQVLAAIRRLEDER